jgi:TPR repeat protein
LGSFQVRNNPFVQTHFILDKTLYEAGRGVEKNQKLAIKWYRRAAKQGVKEAQQRLESLSPKRRPKPDSKK